jgi:hypothetical protein
MDLPHGQIDTLATRDIRLHSEIAVFLFHLQSSKFCPY